LDYNLLFIHVLENLILLYTSAQVLAEQERIWRKISPENIHFGLGFEVGTPGTNSTVRLEPKTEDHYKRVQHPCGPDPTHPRQRAEAQ